MNKYLAKGLMLFCVLCACSAETESRWSKSRECVSNATSDTIVELDSMQIYKTFFKDVDSVLIDYSIYGYIFLSRENAYVENIGWKDRVRSSINNADLLRLIQGVDLFVIEKKPIVKKVEKMDEIVAADYPIVEVLVYKKGRVRYKFIEIIGVENSGYYYTYDDDFLEWFDLVRYYVYDKTRELRLIYGR